jgi:hypothetical protein
MLAAGALCASCVAAGSQPGWESPRRFRLGEVRLMARGSALWMTRVELSLSLVAAQSAPMLTTGTLAISSVAPLGDPAAGESWWAAGVRGSNLDFREPVRLSVPAHEPPGFRGDLRLTSGSPIYFSRERTAEAVGSILEMPRKTGQLGYRLPLDDGINLQPELVFTLRPGQNAFNASKVVGGSVRLVFTF